MDMKSHILAALREELDQWDALLASLNESQLTAPLEPSPWTVKDVLAHVMAWQQRSVARMEAGRFNREPVFPDWLAGVDPEAVEDTDPVNNWIYNQYRDHTFPQVHQAWRAQYLRFLEVADTISEKDLLDTSRYPWMGGYCLADVLLGSYDHHQEHSEKLQEWLKQHRMVA